MVVPTAIHRKGFPMTNSTVATVSSAIPDLPALVALLTPELQELYDHVQVFRQQPPTPERTCALEKNIAASLREVGRVLVESEYNGIEPERLEECPLRL